MPFSNMEGFLAAIPAILIAITFHEYAHGKVACLLGDPTPGAQGRLTLNPLAHLDPIGTFLLFVAGFGWAKPVQVNPLHFKGDRKRGMMFVGLAGPLMNLVLAYLSAVALQIFFRVAGNIGAASGYLQQFLYLLLFYNVILAVFNLLPIPPLDGSKILAGILPYKHQEIIYNLEKYGAIILLVLIFSGITGVIIGGPSRAIIEFLLYLSSFSF